MYSCRTPRILKAPVRALVGLLCVGSLALAISQPTAPDATLRGETTTAVAEPGPFVVFDGRTGDAERSAWAFDQFETAGLNLVAVEVRFADEPGSCGGHTGLHRPTDGLHIVVVCNRDDARRRRTLLHELAHVWAAENLDAATKAAFLAARDLTSWHEGVAWHRRGTEHAAEIVAWGVARQPCWVTPRAVIGEADLNELAAQFELLTGRAPRCDSDAVQPDEQRERQTIE